MWVRDDEVGIDDEVIRDKPPAGTSACRGCAGAGAVGGRLEVRSKAGEVTVVDLNIPAAGRTLRLARLGDVAPDGVATRTDILKL